MIPKLCELCILIVYWLKNLSFFLKNCLPILDCRTKCFALFTSGTNYGEQVTCKISWKIAVQRKQEKLTFVAFTCSSTFCRLRWWRFENRWWHQALLNDLLLSRWWAERSSWNIVVVCWRICQTYQTIIRRPEAICINYFHLLAFLDAQFGTALCGDVIWYYPRHLHNSSLRRLIKKQKKIVIRL